MTRLIKPEHSTIPKKLKFESIFSCLSFCMCLNTVCVKKNVHVIYCFHLAHAKSGLIYLVTSAICLVHVSIVKVSKQSFGIRTFQKSSGNKNDSLRLLLTYNVTITRNLIYYKMRQYRESQ